MIISIAIQVCQSQHSLVSGSFSEVAAISVLSLLAPVFQPIGNDPWCQIDRQHRLWSCSHVALNLLDTIMNVLGFVDLCGRWLSLLWEKGRGNPSRLDYWETTAE